MSCTEIFAFGKDGNAYLYGTTHNAWRGAVAVWKEMEKRHLPPYAPEYIRLMPWYYNGITPEEVKAKLGYTPSRALAFENEHTEEIWELYKNQDIPENERIVLATTFDFAIVKRKNIPDVIDAFLKFGGETSLPEQAAILEKMLHDPDIIAVGWNQTSVNGDTWINAGGYDKETDETLPYNCLTMSDHWWIFNEECDKEQNKEKSE